MNKSNWLCVVVLLVCALTWISKGDVAAQVGAPKAAGRYQIASSGVNASVLFMVDSATGELWHIGLGGPLNEFSVVGHIPKPKAE